MLTVVTDTTCGERQISYRIKPSLDFKDSCFAKGTSILLADGRHIAVEDIKMGDRVIANERGITLTVVSASRGGEDHPLVHILDDKGHDVLLTETHPVVTSAGILQADAVQSGSVIETESG